MIYKPNMNNNQITSVTATVSSSNKSTQNGYVGLPRTLYENNAQRMRSILEHPNVLNPWAQTFNESKDLIASFERTFTPFMIGRLGKSNTHRLKHGFAYIVLAMPQVYEKFHKSWLDSEQPRLKFMAPNNNEVTISVAQMLILNQLGYVDASLCLTDKKPLTVLDGIDALARLSRQNNISILPEQNTHQIYYAGQWPYMLIAIERLIAQLRVFSSLSSKEQDAALELAWCISVSCGNATDMEFLSIPILTNNYKVPYSEIRHILAAIKKFFGLPDDLFNTKNLASTIGSLLKNDAIENHLMGAGEENETRKNVILGCKSMYSGNLDEIVRNTISPAINQANFQNEITFLFFEALSNEKPGIVEDVSSINELLVVHPLDARTAMHSPRSQEQKVVKDSDSKKRWQNSFVAEFVANYALKTFSTTLEDSIKNHFYHGNITHIVHHLGDAKLDGPSIPDFLSLLNENPAFSLDDIVGVVQKINAVHTEISHYQCEVEAKGWLEQADDKHQLTDSCTRAITSASNAFSQGELTPEQKQSLERLKGILQPSTIPLTISQEALDAIIPVRKAIDDILSEGGDHLKIATLTSTLMAFFCVLKSEHEKEAHEASSKGERVRLRLENLNATALTAITVLSTSTPNNQTEPDHTLNESTPNEDLLEEVDLLRQKVDMLNSLLEDRRKETIGLRESVASFQRTQKKSISAVDSVSRAAELHTPKEMIKLMVNMLQDKSPAGILKAAADSSDGKLIILPSALESAKCYQRDAYSAQDMLLALTRLWRDYLPAYLSGGDNKARHVFGDAYSAKESEFVMSCEKLIRLREFEDVDGQAKTFTQHLSINRFLRIYFRVDQKAKNIIIAYAGNHLETPSTN